MTIGPHQHDVQSGGNIERPDGGRRWRTQVVPDHARNPVARLPHEGRPVELPAGVRNPCRPEHEETAVAVAKARDWPEHVLGPQRAALTSQRSSSSRAVDSALRISPRQSSSRGRSRRLLITRA